VGSTKIFHHKKVPGSKQFVKHCSIPWSQSVSQSVWLVGWLVILCFE